jgi:urease accessory protein
MMVEIADLPDELRGYSDPVRGGLDVGAAGKVGRLDLALAPQAGSTRVCRHYQRAPLHVYRPIYLDSNRPDMAFIFLQQYGDGLVQGDRYYIDIDCAPGSAVHVTTQAATKVYSARQNYAAQLVNLRVGAGAVLEYLPDPVLPFRGSRLFQRLCLTAHYEGSVILGETLLPGRTAHGEAHAYDLVWTETEVRRPDGTLLFADVLRLHPGGGDNPTSIGLLGGHDLIATLYVISQRPDPASTVSRLRAALESTAPHVLAGVSELPGGCGAAVRLLGSTSKEVQHALRTTWNAARLVLHGIPAPDLRKG